MFHQRKPKSFLIIICVKIFIISVFLDNSDLNLKIVPTDFCSAVAMSSRGFGYMWAGARATQGASRGRVCYEVRIDNNQPTTHLPNESTPNVLRCGW